MFLPAVCNLFRYIENNSPKNELKNLYIKQLAKPIWDICYNGFHQPNKKDWIRNLAELLVFLYDEGECYRKKAYSHLFSYIYTEFLEILIQYYFRDISEVKKVDEELVDYLITKIENSKSHDAQKYFGILLFMGKYAEQYIEYDSRKRTISAVHGLRQ